MRQTIDDLFGAVSRLNDIGISLKFHRGKPHLWDDIAKGMLFPIMSLRNMFLWLEAFEKGIQIGRR